METHGEVDRSKREPAHFHEGAQQAKPDAPEEPEPRPRMAAPFGNVVEDIGGANRRKKRS